MAAGAVEWRARAVPGARLNAGRKLLTPARGVACSSEDWIFCSTVMSSCHPDPAEAVGGGVPSFFSSERLWTPRIARLEPWNSREVRDRGLRGHCRALARALRAEPARWSPLQPLVTALFGAVEARSRLFACRDGLAAARVEGLLRMVTACQWWIRRPEEWAADPAAPVEEQWQSLVRHMFCRHDVPPAFRQAWLRPGRPAAWECEIFCHLAQGGSLRRLPGIPTLRKSAAALLWDASCPVEGLAAVRFAQLRALRCTREVIGAFMHSRAALDFSNDGLWIPLCEKMRDCAALDVRAVPLVLDGMRHLAATTGSARARELLKLPMDHLTRHWRATWRQWEHAVFGKDSPVPLDGARRARIVHLLSYRWQPMRGILPWVGVSGSRRHPVRWKITELTELWELIREGAAMRHCVATYGRDCRDGASAIFRLSCERNGVPVPEDACTVEVDPRRRRIVQVKGRWNARPGAGAVAALCEWAALHGLGRGW